MQLCDLRFKSIVLFIILNYIWRPPEFIYELYLAMQDAHLYWIIDRLKGFICVNTLRDLSIGSLLTVRFKPRFVFTLI